MIVRTYIAAGAIKKYSAVKVTDTENTVEQASAGDDTIFGITTEIEVADGNPVDVVHCGIALATAGGDVSAGDLLTSNADGNLVATTTADDRVIAMAIRNMTNGEIAEVVINPSRI